MATEILKDCEESLEDMSSPDDLSRDRYMCFLFALSFNRVIE